MGPCRWRNGEQCSYPTCKPRLNKLFRAVVAQIYLDNENLTVEYSLCSACCIMRGLASFWTVASKTEVSSQVRREYNVMSGQDIQGKRRRNSAMCSTITGRQKASTKRAWKWISHPRSQQVKGITKSCIAAAALRVLGYCGP